MTTAPHALVTGASRGIGLACAAALAERGWRVTLLARDAAALARAAASLPGDAHDTIALDVSDEAAWQRESDQLGDLRGLVCAAAVIDPIGAVGSYAVAAFRRTLEVNVTGTLLAILAALPGLRASSGAIVTFSGGGASAPLPRYDAYAASKAAVARLSENLALELATDGVRVNCVAPGFVATDMHRSTIAAGPVLAGADYYERTRRELQRGGVPAGEAAELVCLLLGGAEDVPFTGKLISAQWDGWRDASFRERLAADDNLATIRRIDDTFFAAVEGA